MLSLLALVAWQGWMTLGLFGSRAPGDNLLNDEPILSGRHPLHLYHGHLGAESLRERCSVCCYDPAFQAGYPKTPVFDSGSRLAELFLTMGGGIYRPVAYKIGLAVCCLSVPLLFSLACYGIGLGAAASCLATAIGLFVCWGTPGRGALEAGDLDLLIASLAALVQFGLLVRFDHQPGLIDWIGILLSGCLGWLANHLLFATLFPLVLLYYLSVGARHRTLSWHVALLVGLMGGLALNLFWLIDWVKHWWIRSPLAACDTLLRHRTFQTVWDAPLWGSAFDRGLAVVLVGGAVLGVLVFNQCKERAAARLLGLAAGGLLTLAVLGIVCEPLGRLGTAQLLVPALWFAALPAAHALVEGLVLFRRRLGSVWRVAGLGLALLVAAACLAPDMVKCISARFSGTTSFEIGLGPEREQLLETLARCTGPEARILWEDCGGPQSSSRWTSLLPLWTGRSFLGGLDPEAGIEHAFAGFVDEQLAGRHILNWSDDQLDDFCRRYNVGWIVCWSANSQNRMRAWKAAGQPIPLSRHRPELLFPVRRPFSFVLKGKARLIHADCQHITLADVAGEDGKVVLSLHHQAGLRASPNRVLVEREPDPNDPIPFIRLRVTSPVARVTLTWEER
jgi:hypothetical protein